MIHKDLHLKSVFLILSVVFLVCACSKTKSSQQNGKITEANDIEPFAITRVTELRKGDIIVRPNLNVFPGTSSISNGFGFGHAALVVAAYQNENSDSLLAGVRIIESIAKDVSADFQIREVNGLVYSRFIAFNNDNFDKRFDGNRYRLRLPLNETQIDSIIAFAMAQKKDHSSWNASKSFPGNAFNDSLVTIGLRKNWADNATWYCSHLVWQSIFYVTGKDTDCNGGYMVYPNDLINSELFKNTATHQGRARF